MSAAKEVDSCEAVTKSSSINIPSDRRPVRSTKSTLVTSTAMLEYRSKLMTVFKTVTTYGENSRILAQPFLNLPSKKQLPRYYKTIKEPISLKRILRCINNDTYVSIFHMVSDFELLFDNARYYNKDDSQLYQDANRLQAIFMAALRDLGVEDLVSPKVHSSKNGTLRCCVPSKKKKSYARKIKQGNMEAQESPNAAPPKRKYTKKIKQKPIEMEGNQNVKPPKRKYRKKMTRQAFDVDHILEDENSMTSNSDFFKGIFGAAVSDPNPKKTSVTESKLKISDVNVIPPKLTPQMVHVKHSEIYLRYIESLSDRRQYTVSRWDRALQEKTVTLNPQHPLPVHWLNGVIRPDADEQTIVQAMWRLRDRLIEDTVGICRYGVEYSRGPL